MTERHHTHTRNASRLPGAGRIAGSGPRISRALLVALLVVLAIAVPVAALSPGLHTGVGSGAAPADASGGEVVTSRPPNPAEYGGFTVEPNRTPTAETNEPSGAKLSGALASEGAELGGEIGVKSVEIRLQQATTPAERAAVVAETATDLREQAATLEHRHTVLNEAQRTGDVSPGAYRHRAADLTADAVVLDYLTNRTLVVAAGLPETERRNHDIDLGALRDLENRTAEFEDRVATDLGGSTSSLDGQLDESTFEDRLDEMTVEGQFNESEMNTTLDSETTVARLETDVTLADVNVSTDLEASLATAMEDYTNLQQAAGGNLTEAESTCLDGYLPEVASLLTAALEAAAVEDEARTSDLLAVTEATSNEARGCLD